MIKILTKFASSICGLEVVCGAWFRRPDSNFKQPLAFSRRDCARGFGKRRAQREKGARDAGSLPDPRAPASRDTEAGRCFSMKRRPDCREPQVRHLSGVPHAMFEALFRTTPGGLTLARSRSSHGSGTYPPLRGPRSCADDGYRLTHNHPEPPVARGRRAGTVRLRLLCRGGTSRRPSHSHRTRSQPRDVRETSLGGSR